MPLSFIDRCLSSRRRRWAAAFGLGLVAALALPPVYAVPLLWLAFPGLILLLDGAGGAAGAFAVAWWFGFGHFSLGLYWISHALLVDPVRFGWMIPFAVFGLGGLLAMFTGAAGWAAWRWGASPVSRGLWLAIAWAAMEWLRSWVLTGFPWNLMASVWLPVLPMAQAVSLAGSYGLGLLTVAVASLAVAWRQNRAAVAAGHLLLAAVFAWGWARLPAEALPTVAGLRLRLVQANIEQTLKWRPELRLQHLRRQLELTRSPGFDAVTDVVWSETAAPSFLDQDAEARALVAQAVPPGGLLLAGAVRGTPSGVEPFRIWNSLLAIDHQGTIVAGYDKAHLVPFGEYVPLRGILPLANKLTAGEVDFSRGPGPTSLELPGLPPVGPLICYEVIFPAEVVDPGHRPRWLLNVTNDGWFGLSAGPYQHFAAARLRAIEQGLSLVRAANTGISAVVDGYGRVVAELGLGRTGVLDSELPTSLAEPPLYARWGDWAFFLLLFLFATCAIVWDKVTKRN
ncbi:MAG TPA: apolipoprotein N-acyltransferase [Rhodospirillaceae bacterium]|nr:apolipoprotein N-acyltransferase [Rhodospirillaceae bacterium]